MIHILQQAEPVLRELAQDVPVTDITSPRIKKILTDMKTALDSQSDGVAIAAPQIGVPLRIFLVSGAVLDMIKYEKNELDRTVPDMVFINPTIDKLSKTTEWMDEGCLSVRYLYGKVKRATKATVTAYDEHGKKFTRGGSGILAQIFQHETDHLDGILFIDKAKEVEELKPQQQ